MCVGDRVCHRDALEQHRGWAPDRRHLADRHRRGDQRYAARRRLRWGARCGRGRSRHTGGSLGSDRDGRGDGTERATGTDPADGYDGLHLDTDGDDLPDEVEGWEYGTDPEVFGTDGDGVDDGTEVERGVDPRADELIDLLLAAVLFAPLLSFFSPASVRGAGRQRRAALPHQHCMMPLGDPLPRS